MKTSKKYLSCLFAAIPAFLLCSCGEDTAEDLQKLPTVELLSLASQLADKTSEICAEVNRGEMSEADAAEKLTEISKQAKVVSGALALKASEISKCYTLAKSPELKQAFGSFAEAAKAAEETVKKAK